MNDLIGELETKLEYTLGTLKSLQSDPIRTIEYTYLAISMCYEQMQKSETSLLPFIDVLSRGLDILLPRLITQDASNQEPSTEDLISDLTFASHYHLVRNFIYYSYNQSDLFDWQREADSIEIKFKDPEIPRQYAQTANSAGILSHASISEREGLYGALNDLLRGAPEFGELATNPGKARAVELVVEEVNHMIDEDFEIFESSKIGDINLTNYSYSEYLSVYKYLTFKAMYHRAHAVANSTWCTFKFASNLFEKEVASGSEVTLEIATNILNDIAFTEASPRVDASYFGITKHRNSEYYFMSPWTFLSKNGFVQFLRTQAIKDPNDFQAKISEKLGHGFVKLVAKDWKDAGFLVQENVKLDHLDPQAPDIDVLVASREPTLGYSIFCCELKATIPANWAKDHQRVLRRDSLPKAFKQIDRIGKVLSTPAGKEFLIKCVLQMDPDPLPDGLAPVRFIVVTTQNCGMLVSQFANCSVIDHATLRHALAACDGDIVYIQHLIEQLKEIFEPGENIERLEFQVQDLTVGYECVSADTLVDFPKNEWRTSGLDRIVADEFLESGNSRKKFMAEFLKNRKAEKDGK